MLDSGVVSEVVGCMHAILIHEIITVRLSYIRPFHVWFLLVIGFYGVLTTELAAPWLALQARCGHTLPHRRSRIGMKLYKAQLLLPKFVANMSQ